MNINLYFDLESGSARNSETFESNFIKIPKKNRKFDDEVKKDKKRHKKEDYSKQRERKREAFE